MTINPGSLYAEPNALAPYYSRFRVSERLLLTGHSHQAWPDRGFAGQRRAWEDAAKHVDDKWERATEKANRVREGYRRLLGDPDGRYSLAASTHDLLVKWFSALPWRRRSQLVTTDAEFYSLRRQLARLEEERIEVVRVPAHPAATVGERLAAATSDRTAAVLASTVFFSSAHIAGGFDRAAEACRRHGALLLLDAYHQLNVVPFSLRDLGLEDAYVVSAGYKYCQLGEGNAILRFPEDCELRPMATGWFAEFGELTEEKVPGQVTYNTGDDRFAGATYDPTSHYRAAEVFDFFDEQGLNPQVLRVVSQHQIGLLSRLFDELDLDPELIDRDRSVSLEDLGGFLALDSPRAGDIHRNLKNEGVSTDFRGQILRLGPAPYLSDRQLETAMELLGQVVGLLRR
jgi:selenocysteine lyase/cysteine desulfurase